LCYNTTFDTAAHLGRLWDVGVTVKVTWQFSAPSGKEVDEVVFHDSQIIRLNLSNDGASGWQLPPPTDANSSLSDQFAHVVTLTGQSELALQLHGLGWSVVIAREHGLEGCELIAQMDQQVKGTFIWRFGALLAADDAAHRLLPALPLAPLEEIISVEQEGLHG
jgi:hypothetical protein